MNIVENGKDSFQKCVKTLLELESLSTTDATYDFKLKDVIINLHHSTEVLFKYLVSIKSDFLIYAAPLDAVKKAYKDRERGHQFDGSTENTIQFLDAVNLVYVLYNLDIKSYTNNLYIELNKKRNAITHFTHDFSVEHTLNSTALLMNELYGIYVKYIEGFKEFANDVGLNKDISNIENQARLDMLEINLNLLQKVILAKNEFKTNKTNIRSILEKRDRDLHYDKCVVCGKDSFKVKSHFIVTHEQTTYIGKCEICKYEVDYDNAPLVVHHCKSVPSLYVGNLVDSIISSLNDIIVAINNYKFDTVETLIATYKNEIEYLLRNHHDKFEKHFLIDFGWFLDRIYSKVMEIYFEKEYYFYNDVIEELHQFKDAKLNVSLINIHDILISLSANDFKYKYLKLLFQIDSYNTNSLISNLMKKVTTKHVSYHPAMYVDGHSGEDVEYELEISMTLEVDEKNDIDERVSIDDTLRNHLINVDDSEVYYEALTPYDH